ncbi:hypothetical protein B0H19DRAFT_957586, partial [Mycena capillaripes]
MSSLGYPGSPRTDPGNTITPSRSSTPPSEIALDFPGFPTYAQYKLIEDAHISRLSTKNRQERTLISQATFDRIWDVLSDSTKFSRSAAETTQFRFWARKNFTMGSPPSAAGHLNGSEVTLLHKGLVVAVREKLYQLLCHCHGETKHGGSDATTDFIRQRYSYVPKTLVDKFLQACP